MTLSLEVANIGYEYHIHVVHNVGEKQGQCGIVNYAEESTHYAHFSQQNAFLTTTNVYST